MTLQGVTAVAGLDPETEAGALDHAIDTACARIAPTWPLDRFIAVNPLWQRIESPLPVISAEMAALSGAKLVMPSAWFREEWRQGRLQDDHLEAAIVEAGSPVTLRELHAHLEGADRESPTPRSAHVRQRVMDVLDADRHRTRQMAWRHFVVHSSSQFCAAHFDDGQARLRPERDCGLYASWRRAAPADRSPALLMGLRTYERQARDLPSGARETITTALRELEVRPGDRAAYLTGLLLDLNGWASWCAYREWTARLSGSHDDSVAQILALRAAWELLLFRSGGAALTSRWRAAMAAWPAVDSLAVASQKHEWLLQRALEIAWQRDLCRRLPAGFTASAAHEPDIQAVFCIDVRSEVYRRALETTGDGVQTLGFAGFFGMPIEYQSVGSAAARPQLPGLLRPLFRVSDVGLDDGAAGRRVERLALGSVWRSFKTGALSSFAFVESMGLLFGAHLALEMLGRGSRRAPDAAGLGDDELARRRPKLTALAAGGTLSTEARSSLAQSMLRAMGLTRGFARLVVLVGHGAKTRNNPHAAGLDCGACCGQTGEVNARAAADLLNDLDVRSHLATAGIVIPDTTRFVAGLHDTTTDRVTLFDIEDLAATHAGDLTSLRERLEEAWRGARRERSTRLGLSALSDADLAGALDARAADWAQVRPEWGLAGNAAFIAARRECTRHIDLQGRAFLHDYRFEDDREFATLEAIMTAPMIVAHWINLQYYASVVDSGRYGSGNKALHNVVGGHIGVFEGNGGDLRIGLPLQSVHDGERWVHTPLRLSVFLEAPCDAIDRVIARHETVRRLVDNEWLFLFQIDAEGGAIRSRRDGAWRVVSAEAIGQAKGVAV
jgi:uncharacterized protein YbcC (UPF0753/DUF2309 family)